MNLKDYLEAHSESSNDAEYLIKCTRSFESEEEEEELDRSLNEWIPAFMKAHPIISMIAIARKRG